MTYHLLALPDMQARCHKQQRELCKRDRRRSTNSSHESYKPNTMRVVTGLDRVPQDAPSSMIHGAAMAVLHIAPLSLIKPVQQFIC